MTAQEKKKPGPNDRLVQERRGEVYVQSLLREGEKLIMVAGIHPGIYWKGILLFVVSLLLMIKVFNLGAFLMFVSLLLLSVNYLTRHYLLLALTDKRVLVRHGIINLDTIEVHQNRIESVEVHRTIMARLLGYGTVIVTGTGSRVTAVPFIDGAEQFRSVLDSMILAREDKKAGG